MLFFLGWSKSPQVSQVSKGVWGIRFCGLFSDYVDGYLDGFGGHAFGLAAGLIAEFGFDEVVAGGGDNLGLDCEFAGVDAEFGCGVGR